MKVGSHRSGSNLVRVALNVTSLTLIGHAEYTRSSISSIYSRQQHLIKLEDGGFWSTENLIVMAVEEKCRGVHRRDSVGTAVAYVPVVPRSRRLMASNTDWNY